MLNDIRESEGNRREWIVEVLKDLDGKHTGYLHKGELVRCKDCKWWIVAMDENNSDEDYLKCNMDKWPDADDYCSWGERKSDE